MVPCESLSSPISGVSERSRCGAVRILELAGEPSAGIGRVGSLAGEPSAGIGVVPCESLSSPMNPLRESGVSERSRCGAVRILELAGEPSAGIGRVGSLAGEPSAGIGRVGALPSLSSPANPLRACRIALAVVPPILERFRRRGRAEEGRGGRREEEGWSREEGGGGRREEGEEQAADAVGRELLLDEVEEAVALGHRRVVGEVPGVERREVVAAQIAPVRFRLGVGVAGELSVVSERMVLTPRGARGRSALIIGGVTLVRSRDSNPLALTAACRPALG